MSFNEENAHEAGEDRVATGGEQTFTTRLAIISVAWILTALLAGVGFVAFSDVIAALAA